MTDVYISYFKLNYDNTESYKELEKFFVENGFKKLSKKDIESEFFKIMCFKKGKLKITVAWSQDLVTLKAGGKKRNNYIKVYFDEITKSYIQGKKHDKYVFLYKNRMCGELVLKKQRGQKNDGNK